ncbi:hypothetical protein C0J52_20894, partial [Blattella germanica]
FPVFRVQPARELPSVSRFVRRVDRRPVSEDFEPAPVPPLPDPASIPSILKKKEEDGEKKEEDGAEKRHIRFGPDVKKE